MTLFSKLAIKITNFSIFWLFDRVKLLFLTLDEKLLAFYLYLNLFSGLVLGYFGVVNGLASIFLTL